MRENVEIPRDGTAAARFLALMAYPGVTNETARERWAKAALAMPFKVHGRHPPAWLQGIRAEHEKNRTTGRHREGTRLDTVYWRGVKRLQHRRRTAVWMFVRLAAPAARGGLTFMEACREVLEHAPAGYGFGNDANTVAKCFRESEPALAMGFPVFWLTAAWKPGRERSSPQLRWEDLIYRDCADVPWVDWAIAMAHAVAPMVEDVRPGKRLLLPKRPGRPVPQLKTPVSFPQSAEQIKVAVRTAAVLDGAHMLTHQNGDLDETEGES